MIRAVLALTLVLTSYVYAQDSSERSQNFDESPLASLKNFKADDVSRQLGDDEREKLVELFIRSYVAYVRKNNRDYLLEVNTPSYRLLKSHFPDLVGREGEGGISLGAVTRFFNRMPKYKNLVEQALREDSKTRKRCR